MMAMRTSSAGPAGRQRVLMARQARMLVRPMAAAVAAPEVLRSSRHDAGLKVEVSKLANSYEVDLYADPPRPMVLHWAINDWNVPPKELWPPGTNPAGDMAVQTHFNDRGHVHLSFKQSHCPQKIVFVLKELQPENWLNDGGTDFTVHLKPPGLDSVAQKIIDAEATYTHWSLFQRFCMAIEVLDAADAAGAEGMALIYTWLRLSSMRQLDWYRNSNYQSKDIAHVQKSLAEKMTDKARSAEDGWSRLFARMALEGLPRGGGNGDDIRMGILHIMRANGIKEGHRPGIDEQFLEQWHQKLHTNTTPDDVAICEAYLAFLHSGNHDDYWRVLWDNGRLTKADLEGFSKPIRAWPMHLPHLIDSFKHYLWLLKVTHSGADLDTAAEMAKGHIDDDLRWHLFDMLTNRNEWWVPGKIVELRGRLSHYWKQPGATRDLLLLDIALESWFRLRLEQMDVQGLQQGDLMELVSLVLRNAVITDSDPDLQHALEQWEWVKTNSGGSSMQLMAALQRVELTLAAHMDRLFTLVQPHAEAFAKACKLDRKYIMNFGEEVARGRPLFVLSRLLDQLEHHLHGSAAPWQVVSAGPGSACGILQTISKLADVQGMTFTQPTVLFAQQLDGNEDIPANVMAVLTPASLDVLSHAAIRARAQRVLLACSNFDKDWQELQALASQAGCEAAGQSSTQPVTVTISGDGSVQASLGGDLPGVSHHNGVNGRNGAVRMLQAPKPTNRWVLTGQEFSDGLTGAKALNCHALLCARGHYLPDKVGVPASLSLPLGTFERVLAQPENRQVAQQLSELERVVSQKAAQASAQSGSMADALQVLSEVRALVSKQLTAPAELIQELASTAAAAGMIPSASTWTAGSAAWAKAWSAICQVWASKWNDRAWLSRRALGVPDDQLVMAVLLQQVVPAEYAFVLHTAHPVTGATGQLFGEVVVGMGETLVGNYPGRALSFYCNLNSMNGGGGGCEVVSLPSKRTALYAAADAGQGVPLLIARSDANGEDLKDMAGAGLYDSVPFCPLEEKSVPYAHEPLFTDEGFRSHLLAQLADVGRAVRDAYGGVEQDVEGVVRDGKVWVVQSRPQIIHT